MPMTHTQLSLFDKPGIETHKTHQISLALDKINKRYGRGTVHMAACGPRLSWKDRKAKKSPSYLTAWGQLPRVVAK